MTQSLVVNVTIHNSH